ncbi:MAG: hypothetical protein DMG78_29775, partial [Acidobacteria bacterium]
MNKHLPFSYSTALAGLLFHVTIEAIHGTMSIFVLGTLKLNGSMRDSVFLTQYSFQVLQSANASAGWQIGNQRVAGEGQHITGDAPDMQIMYIANPLNRAH